MTKNKIYKPLLLAAALSACMLSACTKAKPITATPSDAVETAAASNELQMPDGMKRLTPDGPEYEYIEKMNIPETEPAPEYLRNGVQHAKVAELQARLMELGFMENDEPTEYYGPVTEAAVRSFQRQNELAMDGIVGSTTWDSIMNPDAKYYAVAKGEIGRAHV